MRTRSRLILFGLALAALAPLGSAQRRSTGYERHAQPVRAAVAALGDARIHNGRSSVRSCDVGRTFGRRNVSRQVFVPGHFQSVNRRVWVPERYESVWIDPLFNDCGQIVREGYYTSVFRPAHFETRAQRIWVPGRYVYR